MTATLAILFVALVADWLFGEPERLWRSVPHPVVLFGRLIGRLDAAMNRAGDTPGRRRAMGGIALIAILFVAVLAGAALEAVAASLWPVGAALEAFVVFALLAQKSLKDHVADVADTLSAEGLDAARNAVGRIVGRDPRQLDRAGVSRAAIESLGENFGDGVVAPALWYVLFGLPGILACKALNTADSMIGHRSEKYLDFGRYTALADDFANFVPARLSALLIAAGAGLTGGIGAARASLGAALRDAGLHRSPNAGWGEAAMAGALGIALGGPRRYAGETVQQAHINAAGRHDIDFGDIRAANAVFERACFCLWAAVGLAAFAV
jgi:adenosylcobinamide-phosphate synthase